MDERTLRKALSKIPLGGLRYYEKTGSTNDVALAWAAAGAPDLALVYAEEQTAGRGRGSHGWFTPAGAALAFSLVIRPAPGQEQATPLFSALGALAVCEVLTAQGQNPKLNGPTMFCLTAASFAEFWPNQSGQGRNSTVSYWALALMSDPKQFRPPPGLIFQQPASRPN